MWKWYNIGMKQSKIIDMTETYQHDRHCGNPLPQTSAFLFGNSLNHLCLNVHAMIRYMIKFMLGSIPHQIIFFVIYLLEEEQELSLGMLIRLRRIYNFYCFMTILYNFYILLATIYMIFMVLEWFSNLPIIIVSLLGSFLCI